MNESFKRDFHYVWLGENSHELTFAQYLSILSILKYCKPETITIWSETDIIGEYYDQIKDYVTIVRIIREKEIFGNLIVHTPLHGWSDIYRNMIIYENGGIYCDFDILWCKDIDPLLDQIEQFGIAYQGINGAEGCNMGVMIGVKGHRFCEEFLKLFTKYDEWEQRNHIGLFSTSFPKMIAEQMRPNITILPYDTFHWPLYHTNSIRWFYFNKPDDSNTLVDTLSGQRSSDLLMNNYAHHCFGIHHDGIREFITEEFIMTNDTSFTRKVKPVLEYGKNNILHTK
jgi:hypothetical protein